MSFSLAGFDANQVEPHEGFDVLPAGEYDVCVVASSMKDAKKGGGKFLEFELQVLSGPYQNRKLWDRLNLVNSNDKAVQIAKGTLSAICRAVGVLTPQDSSELHNKPIRCRVKVRRQEGYDDTNEITSYKSRAAQPQQTEQMVPAVAGSSPSQTPW